MKTYRLHLPSMLEVMPNDARRILLASCERSTIGPLSTMEEMIRSGMKEKAEKANDPPPRIERKGNYLEIQTALYGGGDE